MLPVSLDCPFFIAPQFCLSSSTVSCVPNVARGSGLSNPDCPSVLFVLQVTVSCTKCEGQSGLSIPEIANSLFVLQNSFEVQTNVVVSLDCPFLIAPQFCVSSSSVLCTKCCQFLWIVQSSLPLSCVCLRPQSCVPNVVSFSGLSILDCPSVLFVFVQYQMLSVLCTKCCQGLWIVHS